MNNDPTNENNQNQFDPDNPIHQLALSILEYMQQAYGHLSPMSHIIALSFATSQIAYAIDLQAQQIISDDISIDFMTKAADMAGVTTASPIQTIEWNPAKSGMTLPPPCPHCTTSAPPLSIEDINYTKKQARASCSVCNTKFYLTLIGGQI